MQGGSFQRMYVLLRGTVGQANGFARVETQRKRSRLSIHASHLPEGPVRALVLAGEGQSGAVMDLGLMIPGEKHQSLLCRENLLLHGYHTLALATDWPGAELVLYGWLRRQPLCTLWQMQETVRRYLVLPAPDSAPAPLEMPLQRPKPSVLMLRGT